MLSYFPNESDFFSLTIFGSFGLSTKEPYTVMFRALSSSSCKVGIGICAHLPLVWGFDIEASYLVHVCNNVPHICTSNI